MSVQSAVLIVLSRAPVPGQTKTRLIPAVGAEGAAAFHAACLADVLDVAAAWRSGGPAAGQRRTVTLSITPTGSWPAFAAAGIELPESVQIAEQRGETLGDRMVHALQNALETAQIALLVGSDLPLLTVAHLEQAATALGESAAIPADLVLGPALDGGYYLVGTRRDAQGWSQVLRGGDWGGGSVLERTLARSRDAGLRTGLTAALPDADSPQDLGDILDHPLAAQSPERRSVRWLRATLRG